MSDATRRNFLRGAGVTGAALIVAPEALATGVNPRAFSSAAGGTFAEGIIAGDPTTSGMTLWTRLHDVAGKIPVALEVATDKGFRKVVAKQKISAVAASDFSVKAQIKGLKPYTQYYYRFATKSKDSPVGRFRTALPADSNEKVRFAFFSCQDYTFGYYNAHAAMAKDDLDFVVNLGDYIYAEAYHKTSGDGVRNDPGGESVTLKQYRDKYKLYRSDANLRAMHANFAMVSTWDDHEVVNNYAGGAGPTGGLSADKKYTLARQKAGYQAFFESMPISPIKGGEGQQIYRSLRFGKHLELIMLDERQYRDDQPLDDSGQVDLTKPENVAALKVPRQYLGAKQLVFLKDRLKNSTATWKVIANEAMMMNTKFTSTTDYNLDDWTGYQAQRSEVLSYIRDNSIKNVISVVGDIHTFAAGDLRVTDDDATPVGIEFVGGSICSQGLGDGGLNAAFPGLLAADVATTPFPRTGKAIYDILLSANPWLTNGDVDHHGYGRIKADGAGFGCDLVRMKTVKKKSTEKMPLNDPASDPWNGISGSFSWTIKPGQAGLKG